jgi:hypothetical protein
MVWPGGLFESFTVSLKYKLLVVHPVNKLSQSESVGNLS